MKLDIIRILQHSSSLKGIRSTGLKPLMWLIGMMLPVIVSLIFIKADTNIVTAFIVLIFVVVLCFLGAFLYFMIKKPDMLFSESFNIQKHAIEKGITGDDLKGIFTPEKLDIIEETQADSETKIIENE